MELFSFSHTVMGMLSNILGYMEDHVELNRIKRILWTAGFRNVYFSLELI